MRFMCALNECELNLKINFTVFSQYPSIHSDSNTPITLYPTAPLYDIIIIFDTVGRNEFVNAKNNEFNSAAISLLWHPSAMLCGIQINVAGIQQR